MSHGERRSRKSHNCGRDYWKPQGMTGRVKGVWKASVSSRAGTNKKTKRITHKAIRKQKDRMIEDELEL